MTLNFKSIKTALHWPSVHKNFWFFTLTCMSCTSLLVSSGVVSTLLKERAQLAQNNLDDIKDIYNDSQTETQLIKQYNHQYSNLTYGGFIGDEDRLSWVESIKDIKQGYKLPELGYTFKPIIENKDFFGLQATEVQLYTSENKINFTLHDETDLVAILGKLKEGARGLYSINNCTLTRKEKELKLNKLGNITGDCTLSWFTVQPRTIDNPDGGELNES